MKGRQLILEEVLKLEDGTKVWVEDSQPDYSCLCFLNLEEEELAMCEDNTEIYIIDQDLYLAEENKDVEFYEWIEELFIPDKIETPYYSYEVIKDMATEICNLRGIDLTEDNIDKIMKEFK